MDMHHTMISGVPGMSGRQLPIVLALGTTQTLAWASSVYLPALVADPIAHDLGISSNWIFGAYSAALVIRPCSGPRVGRQIDRVGGRPVLSISNLTLAGGLVLLGFTQSIWMLVAGLAAARHRHGLRAVRCRLRRAGAHLWRGRAQRDHRHHLDRGLCFNIGWPLTALGVQTIGWRETCFAWAAAHILMGLPINLLMLPAVQVAKATAESHVKPHIPIDRTMALLAFAFAAAWMVTGAMAAHFPRILEAAGASPVQAVAAGALIGPAQVAARIFEASFLKRYHPIVSARLACLMHPIGAAIVWLTGGAATSVFAVFHGAGNGVITIARGTLPLAIFGPQNYGYRLGLIGAPARMTQAAAPCCSAS